MLLRNVGVPRTDSQHTMGGCEGCPECPFSSEKKKKKQQLGDQKVRPLRWRSALNPGLWGGGFCIFICKMIEEWSLVSEASQSETFQGSHSSLRPAT